MSVQFVYAPHVRSVIHGDRTVVLDLRREKYYSLDTVGTRVWAMLGDGADVSAIVATLSEEFDAPAERIAGDVETLLRQLADDWNVIAPALPPPPPVEPSGFTCALTLWLVVLALRVTGLRRTLVVAEWLGRRAPLVAAPSPEFLASVVRRVATTAAFFPGRALCLEQSMALYVSLRRSGVPARFRIGAQPYPFAAHAWVEYRGELVGASYDQVSKFVPFDRLMEPV